MVCGTRPHLVFGMITSCWRALKYTALWDIWPVLKGYVVYGTWHRINSEPRLQTVEGMRQDARGMQ